MSKATFAWKVDEYLNQRYSLADAIAMVANEFSIIESGQGTGLSVLE